MSIGTPKLFVGGPLHGEMLVVDPESISIVKPFPVTQRKDVNVPEWMTYTRSGDEMHFAGRSVTYMGRILARRLGGTEAKR